LFVSAAFKAFWNCAKLVTVNTAPHKIGAVLRTAAIAKVNITFSFKNVLLIICSKNALLS
jgi:hypothetical protein